MNTTHSATTDRGREHFLPHIQGLRAIAVLLVVLFHFWPGRLSGGYIGVDVFFVISGFLITGQLVRELRATQRISLPGFWAKRVRRLMPAALVVLIFSALATAFLMPLSYMPRSIIDISTSMLYVENWQLVASASDYLNSVNGTIAEHYWSLSVEEQFYVVWPLLLMGTFALGAKLTVSRRWALLAWVVVGASLLSLVASIIYTQYYPSQAYFVLFTRVFEFGAGALLVMLPRLRPRGVWMSNLIGLAGLALLIFAAVRFTQATPFPGFWALVPVIGSCLIIVILPNGAWWSMGRLLSVWPMRFLGDISYSLYLWHWPLIFIAPFIIGWGLTPVNRLILFASCFVLAWLTKRFVEDPFRRLPALTSRKPRYTFGWMAASFGLVAIILGSIFAIQNPKYEAARAELAAINAHPPVCFGAEVITDCHNPELVNRIIPDPGFGNADEPGNPQCFVQLNASKLVPCSFGSQSPSAPRIALVGDSHAYQYLDTFIRMAEKNGWSLTTYFKGACPWTTAPVGGTDPGFVASCTEFRRQLASELESQGFDVIFTAAYSETEYLPDTSSRAVAEGFAEAWSNQSGGAEVLTIVDNPHFSDDPNKCLRSSQPSVCSETRSDALPAVDPLSEAALLAGIHVVDFSSTYCSSSECFAVIGGADVYRDENHLTVTFANSMQFALEPAILGAISRTK